MAICELCKRPFKRQKDVDKHIRYSAAHATRSKCEACDRTFNDDKALQQHLQSSAAHTKILPGASTNGAFTGNDAVQTLAENLSTLAIGPECAPCGRMFVNIEALQAHVRDSPMHTAGSEPQQRNQKISRADSKRQHDTGLSAGEDCRGCDLAFATEAQLQDHIQEDHAGVVGPKSSMHPRLHDEVQELLESAGLNFDFHSIDSLEGLVKEYDTAITGRFLCSNPSCGADRWSSMKIAITIRRFDGNRYNAVVWHQLCQRCDKHGRPVLEESYAERVAYRLKVWSKVRVEPPPFRRIIDGPHDNKRCEGCKNGRCREYEANPELFGGSGP